MGIIIWNEIVFSFSFSSHRVIIEHVNGSLKETFASLKELRIRIVDKESHAEACNWITAALILYNILLPLKNYQPQNISLENSELSSVDFGYRNNHILGKQKRLGLMNYVLS
jgi:hypothetical protein